MNLKTLFKTIARCATRRGGRDRFSAFRIGSSTVEEMSREQLIAHARELDVELARLTAQYAKPLGRAVKFARMNAHRCELGVTTAWGEGGAQTSGYHSAFHVVFEIAEQALRRASADRQVERQLACQYPEAAAALVATRRHVLRDTLDWPYAARFDYERDISADGPGFTPSMGQARAHSFGTRA